MIALQRQAFHSSPLGLHPPRVPRDEDALAPSKPAPITAATTGAPSTPDAAADAIPATLRETMHGRLRVYQVTTPTASSSLSWSWRSAEGHAERARWLNPGQAIQFLRSTFLPVGYPHSVHPSYARFHVWKFAETTIACAIGVLASQALLTALGVGAGASAGAQAAGAAGTAVAVQWILKDGLGEVGKLVLIQQFASQFDSRLRTWKLAGEVASVLGVFTSMLTAVAPSTAWFLPLASIGGALKSFYFTLWSTVHASFARQWAARANLADILAKDEAQLSVASMLGAGVGVALIALVRHDAPFLFGCLAVFAPAQLFCSVSMLRSAHFTMLSDVKLALIARHWLDATSTATATADHHAVTEIPPPIASSAGLTALPEHGFMGEFLVPSPRLPMIRPGVALVDAFTGPTATTDLAAALRLLHRERYLIQFHPSASGTSSTAMIALRADARARDISAAVLHSILAHEQGGDVAGTYARARELAPRFYSDLAASPDWDAKRVYFDDRGVRYSLPGIGAHEETGDGE
ncbi:hypothetical protein H9P43_000952 [Blastocladiella emersonii ATCC 22665]|nr:hypothetical protein H9P43_000952 [Blastocladiella emersonii ATCC 22665]